MKNLVALMVVLGLMICIGCGGETKGKKASSKQQLTPPPKAGTSEAKPAESKPAETKPAETKPAETKPAETKPAEAPPAKSETPPPPPKSTK